MSLVARYLEENGFPTVIIGSALDIVTHCGVPRYVFTDFPLGNPCGHPWQPEMNKSIVGIALGLLSTAGSARSIVHAPFAWKDDPGWRARYSRADPADQERLLKLGNERRRQRAKS